MEFSLRKVRCCIQKNGGEIARQAEPLTLTYETPPPPHRAHPHPDAPVGLPGKPSSAKRCNYCLPYLFSLNSSISFSFQHTLWPAWPCSALSRRVASLLKVLPCSRAPSLLPDPPQESQNQILTCSLQSSVRTTEKNLRPALKFSFAFSYFYFFNTDSSFYFILGPALPEMCS